MVLILGIFDLIAGVIGLALSSIGALTEIAFYAFIALMLKGLWSLYSGRNYPLMLLLGLLDLSAGIFGLITLSYNLFSTITYLLSFIVIFKGVWTTFSTLFSEKA